MAEEGLPVYNSVQDDKTSATTTPEEPVVSPQFQPESTPTVPLPKVRIVSLDVFRGFTIITMIFVNLGGGGLVAFNHVGWNGLHPADCVFPFFAWIMGVTMNIGIKSHLRKGTTTWKILLDSFIRSVKLFLLGLFVNNFRSLSTSRVPGVLQSFGFAFFMVTCAIVIGLICKSEVRAWQRRAVEGLVVAVAVSINLILTFCLPIPDCPTGYIGSDIDGCVGGAHFYIDLKVFGAERLYFPGRSDPEGLLNWLMVGFTTYIGYVVGGYFLDAKEWKCKSKILTGTGMLIGLIGLGLAGFQIDGGPIPINKSIWSISFVLVVSGLACIILNLMYLLVDKFDLWHGTPLRETGMNAIALYIGHEVLGQHAPFGWDRDEDSITQNVLSNLGGTICWIFVAMWMYKKNIFITV